MKTNDHRNPTPGIPVHARK